MAAAIDIHQEIVNDDNFAGYGGTKNDFDKLYRELNKILFHEISDCSPSPAWKLERTIETWWDFQGEIARGEREADWYRYV